MFQFYRYDWLEIHDGNISSSPLLGCGRYCGKPRHNPIMSNGNAVLVRLFTDKEITNTGFLIKFEAGNMHY